MNYADMHDLEAELAATDVDPDEWSVERRLGYQQGRDEERAAVVAFLRASGLGFLSGLIDRGKHRG